MAVSSGRPCSAEATLCHSDEVDSVLIDDARTPLIISGPTAKTESDDQFLEYRPYVERLYQAQRSLVNQILNEAKRKSLKAMSRRAENYSSVRIRSPKYQPLIKYLSEPGMKVILQKTENYYIQDNEREMPVITDPLYFVINEQLNSVDMTDKGNDVLAKSVGDENFFIIPDVGSKIAAMEQAGLSPEEKRHQRCPYGGLLPEERAYPYCKSAS